MSITSGDVPNIIEVDTTTQNVVVVGGGASGSSAGGTTGQLQYNNAGAFAGIPNTNASLGTLVVSNLMVISQQANAGALIIQAASGQSRDLIELRDNNSNPLASIDATGNATFPTLTLTTPLAISQGGTGQTTAGGALTALGGVATSRTISSGAGLTGGGALSSNQTISLDLTRNNAWTGQQYFASSALVDGASVAWNLNTAQTASWTIAGNHTLANPTNMQTGSYTLIITQDSSGSRVITWGSAYKFAGGVKFVLSTAIGAVDIVQFQSDGTSMFAVGQKAFS